jgi:hypothetical protein
MLTIAHILSLLEYSHVLRQGGEQATAIDEKFLLGLTG